MRRRATPVKPTFTRTGPPLLASSLLPPPRLTPPIPPPLLTSPLLPPPSLTAPSLLPPPGILKKIEHTKVFWWTTAWSMWAHLWIWLIYKQVGDGGGHCLVHVGSPVCPRGQGRRAGRMFRDFAARPSQFTPRPSSFHTFPSTCPLVPQFTPGRITIRSHFPFTLCPRPSVHTRPHHHLGGLHHARLHARVCVHTSPSHFALSSHPAASPSGRASPRSASCPCLCIRRGSWTRAVLTGLGPTRMWVVLGYMGQVSEGQGYA